MWRLASENREWLSMDGSFDAASLEGADKELYRKTHETIKRFTDNIEDRFHFNTAISAAMELVNEMTGFDAGSAGFGNHKAVESGLNVAKMARKYFATHRVF